MTTIHDICNQLERLAPPELAEDWDNTGLLLGDPEADTNRLMTCLTLTPDSVGEAVEQQAGLVVAHHPLPFRPMASITTATAEGAMLWRLARAGVAVYSPHTSFDSAADGINAQLAEGLGLRHVAPLAADEDDPSVGSGRVGELEAPLLLNELALRAKQLLTAESVRVGGNQGKQISRVAVACGSGGSFIAAAVAAGADALVTGEATFHNCLAAQSAGLALVLPGHYASERFAVERLATQLEELFPGMTVWASQNESDPLRTLT